MPATAAAFLWTATMSAKRPGCCCRAWTASRASSSRWRGRVGGGRRGGGGVGGRHRNSGGGDCENGSWGYLWRKELRVPSFACGSQPPRHTRTTLPRPLAGMEYHRYCCCLRLCWLKWQTGGVGGGGWGGGRGWRLNSKDLLGSLWITGCGASCSF